MFMKTIAVGPFEPVMSCVTGGTTDAIDLLFCGSHSPLDAVASFEVVAARLASFGSAVLAAIRSIWDVMCRGYTEADGMRRLFRCLVASFLGVDHA